MKNIIILIIAAVLISGCISVEKSPTGSTVTQSAPEVAMDAPVQKSAKGGKFNVEIDLPKTFRTISPGDELWFTTKLLNLENDHRIDVTLHYQILDGARNLVFSKSETVAVETQASFVAHLQTPPSLKQGLHFARVVLSAPSGEAEAETTFQVSGEETQNQVVIKFSLFDIQVDIPEDYKEISPGDELLTSIKLINVGSEGRIDIFLDYWITDEDNNVLLSEKETVAVETQNNFIRSFIIPDDAHKGKHTFHAKLSYPGLELEPEYATSFEVVAGLRTKLVYLASLLLLIIVGFFLMKARAKQYYEQELLKIKIKRILNDRKR